MNIKISLLTLLFFSLQISAAQFSESFVVTLFDTKVRVVAPPVTKKSFTLVIENMSASKSIVKVINEKGVSLHYAAIESGKSDVKDLDFKNSKRFYLIPLAPPSQEIELIFGKSDYEIPEKK